MSSGGMDSSASEAAGNNYVMKLSKEERRARLEAWLGKMASADGRARRQIQTIRVHEDADAVAIEKYEEANENANAIRDAVGVLEGEAKAEKEKELAAEEKTLVPLRAAAKKGTLVKAADVDDCRGREGGPLWSLGTTSRKTILWLPTSLRWTRTPRGARRWEPQWAGSLTSEVLKKREADI